MYNTSFNDEKILEKTLSIFASFISKCVFFVIIT